MHFSKLADYFEKLEYETKRNKLVQIMSEVFAESSASEIDKICYLLQGRVVPFFDPTEIGMAEKMVEQAVAAAYSIDRSQVAKLASQEGDMGLAAMQLKAKVKNQKSKTDLTVNEVHEVLLKIANTNGEGSVEKKISQLADLLKKVNPAGAKHLVRIPLGLTRLGIGDPTVLDALSMAKTKDKSLRKNLEEAYNKTSDLGFVAKIFWEKGIKAIDQVELQVGKPMRPALAERLPDAEAVVKRMGDEFAVEPKFDGFRCISGYTPLYVEGKGLISARYVRIGDKVLTHTGNFRKVIATNKRKLDKKERLFKLQTYLGEGIKITEEHPLLVLREEKEQWVSVKEIKKNDQLVFPIPRLAADDKAPNFHLNLRTSSGYSKTIAANRDFYKFLGFWIGDGFTNEYHNTQRIGLTFNEKKELELASTYEKLIKETLLIDNISHHSSHGGFSLYWRDEPLKDWLSTNFRRDWKGKMVPGWFVHISKENFEAFLRGWVESDGTPRHSGGYKITTKEGDLASTVQLIALKHGIVLGIRRVRISGRTYFEIIVPGTAKKATFENSRLLIKIMRLEEIKRRDPRTVVYNFQVEDDETFCIPLATLHNCQVHIEKSKVKSQNSKTIRIFSRNLEDFTNSFPDLVKGAKEEIEAKSVILEGEAIAYNPVSGEFLAFQETTKRRRKYGVAEAAEKMPLKLFCFDLLYLNGKDITKLPYQERRKKLKDIIRDDSVTVMEAIGKIAHNAQDLTTQFEEAITEGLEGVMIKRLDAPYQAGARNFNWIKFKRMVGGELSDTVDCVLLGYIFGTGKRTNFGVGGLLVGVYDPDKDSFESISRIGTGLTDDEWRRVKEMADKNKLDHKPARVNSVITPSVWVEPEIVLEIFADEITRSPLHTAGKKDNEPGYALRFPRLVSFRGSSKRAEDATTVKEIEEMYQAQFKHQKKGN